MVVIPSPRAQAAVVLLSEAGQPAVVPGQPAVVPGQPAVVPGQPAVVPGQPAVVPGQPAVAPGQPAVVPGQPAVAPGQPAVVPGQPAVAPGQPAVVPLCVLTVVAPSSSPPQLAASTIPLSAMASNTLLRSVFMGGAFSVDPGC
jgi:hypothetical protein